MKNIHHTLVGLLFGLASCQINIFEPNGLASKVEAPTTYSLEVRVLNDYQYTVPDATVVVYESENDARNEVNGILYRKTENSTGATFINLKPKAYFFRVQPFGCPNADTTVYKTGKVLKPNYKNLILLHCKLYVPMELVNIQNVALPVKICRSADCGFNGPIKGDVTVPANQSLIIQVPLGYGSYLFDSRRGVSTTTTTIYCDRPNSLRLVP